MFGRVGFQSSLGSFKLIIKIFILPVMRDPSQKDKVVIKRRFFTAKLGDNPHDHCMDV